MKINFSLLRRYLYLAIPLFLTAAVFIFLHKFLESYSIKQILIDLNGISWQKKVLAVILTAGSYLFLTAYDFLGLRYLGKKLSSRGVVFTSFVSYAFSNTVGLSVIASGSLRYRYYTLWGLTFSEISRMIVFTSVTLWLGLLASAGVAFSFEPVLHFHGHVFSHMNMQLIGALFLFLVLAYLVLAFTLKKPLKVFGYSISLPSRSISLAQVAVGSIDWLLAGSVLYVLLPQDIEIKFFVFIGIYLLGQTAGLISHVPGGAIVFESVVLSFFPNETMVPMIGTLIVYRVTYYIIPLVIAAVMLGASESYRYRNRLMGYIGYLNNVYSAATPALLSVTVFIVGFYMLMTGATPINPARFPFVKEVFPLYLVEFSHFLESLVGLGLIILSRGLKHRIDLSYQLTIILLVAGTVFAILKGAEIETAVFTISVITAMMPAKKIFNRKSSFFSEIMTQEWFITIFLFLLMFTWLGFFSYKHVEYSNSLWWTFTFKDQAPRFLRALVGSFTLLAALAFYKMMLPSSRVITNNSADMQLVEQLVFQSPETDAFLAMLPDKQFLMSENDKSFVMYGVDGRNMISMGDPVTIDPDENNVGELIMEFRKLCQNHGCRSVFYEIGTKYIPQYLDAGFKIYKIGEEGRVCLDGFKLEGGKWSGARNTINRMEKEGCSLEIIERDKVSECIDILKDISDQWLENKNTREKKFSLGCFDIDYIKKNPVAVVVKDGEIVAFSNMWSSAGREELSVDMMRYGEDAPKGVMEYLFIKMMLKGKDDGYKYFNLGIAPLSGIDTHPFSPFWNRVASVLYNHGERFYNFKGLRSYKEKFDPDWKPKYIAVESLFALPGAIKSVASLISGGTGGIFTK